MSENTITTVLGRKGSGKSEITREIMAEASRVIVLDYVREYGERDGCQVVNGRDAAFDRLVDAYHQERFRLSIRMRDDEDEQAMLDVLEVAWELSHYLLVVEEASAYCSPAGVPRPIARFVRWGRHRSISQVYVAQRPSMLHRDITSQSDVVVSFQHHEALDVEYLEKTVGEHMGAVRTLGEYEIAVGGPGVELGKVPLAVLARLEEQRARQGARISA